MTIYIEIVLLLLLLFSFSFYFLVFARPICLPFLEEYHVEEKLGEAKILRQDTMVAGWGKVNNGEKIRQRIRI